MCFTPAARRREPVLELGRADGHNYDGIGVNGQPIVPPAGFSWSHSLANITLKQPWESVFFIDRKVRARPPRVATHPPCAPPPSSPTQLLAALTPRPYIRPR